MSQYVVFRIDNLKIAIQLNAVQRIVRAVEVTPLPKAPHIVHGVINVKGQVMPVFNLRKLFRLSERNIDIQDQFIIADTSKRKVVLVIDEIINIVERSLEEVNIAEKIWFGMECFEAVVKLEDELIVILDLLQLLNDKEENILDSELALKGGILSGI